MKRSRLGNEVPAMLVKQAAMGRSGGKVILVGEHSVVYGKPAIAVPVPAASVETKTLAGRDGIDLNCVYYHGELKDGPEQIACLKELIPTVLKKLNQAETGLALTITSNIPVERGMGSSAAVGISVVRSLYRYFGRPLDRRTLLELVGISETCCHGSPSGLDAAAASGTCPLYFVRGKVAEPIRTAGKGVLVIADTGRKGETRLAVTKLKKRLENHAHMRIDIEKLGKIADAARRFLERGMVAELGRGLLEAHRVLRRIGVSHQALDRLVAAAMAGGALGAKMTGGGLGGCMIALAKDADQAGLIANRLLRAGAVGTWIQPFSPGS
jgi:mevalonate kinase